MVWAASGVGALAFASFFANAVRRMADGRPADMANGAGLTPVNGVTSRR